MSEESPLNISDSVVMGDVQQNITNTTCPACGASNVRVMKCQDVNCESKFCEICHKNSRHLGWERLSFDSGKGDGPYCSVHLDIKVLPYEEEVHNEWVKTLADADKHMKELEESEKRFYNNMVWFIIGAIVFLFILGKS